jgi:tetratricopeptide (TPR) repeat protein
VWTAATTEGRSEIATEYAKHVVNNVQPQMARDIPGIEVFTPTLTYTYLRFGKWDEVLAQPKPDENLRYATAIYHYARARAFAAKGNIKEAKAAHAQIVPSFRAQDDQRFQNFGVPGRLLVTIADNVAQADIALAEKRPQRAVDHLKLAVQAQDNLPYTEPPWWDFPVRQYLGAALMRTKNYTEAASVYREDLNEWTRNGWSLYGLSQALQRSGKRREANESRMAYMEAWSRADVKLSDSRF